jgi:hypothetical protein
MVQRAEHLTEQERQSIQEAATLAQSYPAEQSVTSVYSATYKPGDARRIKNRSESPPLKRGRYNGYIEVQVRRSDTLESLATKHIGDPNAWYDIAVVNDLHPPFLSSGARLPNTKAVGDTIVIPVAKPATPVGVATTGNAVAGKAQLSALFGRDIKLTRLANGKYGWAADTGHGSTDVQTIEGVPNLIQGLESRMRTEQGTNPQFPALGLPVLAGEKGGIEQWLEAKFALEAQVLRDPRIESITNMDFSVAGDTVTVHLGAKTISADTSRTIPLQVE